MINRFLCMLVKSRQPALSKVLSPDCTTSEVGALGFANCSILRSVHKAAPVTTPDQSEAAGK